MSFLLHQLRTQAPRYTYKTPIAVAKARTASFSLTSIMAAKNEWLVLMKDKPNSLEARMKVRPQHLEELKPQVESGFWVFGGATLNAPASEGKLDIDGSCMLGVADTKEEILAKLKEDVYAKAGVWDIDNVQIIPFKCAVRKPI